MTRSILDEAHTVEDVAGSHFGLKVSEAGAALSASRCSTTPSAARACSARTARAPTTRSATSSTCTSARMTFFERCVRLAASNSAAATAGSSRPNVVENDLSPKLRDLALHLKAMLPGAEARRGDHRAEQQRAEKVAMMAQTLDAMVGQTI